MCETNCTQPRALQSKTWRITLGETLALPDMSEPKEAQAQLLTDDIETLVSVLGNVCSGLGEEKH